MSTQLTEGKLFLVPTPIGNLEDITLRALRILKEAELILAEDTRTSAFLLKHFSIDTKMQSYHKFNEHKLVEHIASLIEAGKTVALISDAGTPGISDPGFLLVRTCLAHRLDVECLPGATALIPALVNSGLPSDQFVFLGFLPQKKGRQTALKQLIEDERTSVMYESPYRIVKLLDELIALECGDRPIAVSRELTKKFEETIRGSVVEVKAHFGTKEPKGEFVVVLGGKKD